MACAARTDIVFTTDGPAVRDGEDDDDEADLGRNLAGPSKEAIEKFTQHGKYACVVIRVRSS